MLSVLLDISYRQNGATRCFEQTEEFKIVVVTEIYFNKVPGCSIEDFIQITAIITALENEFCL